MADTTSTYQALRPAQASAKLGIGLSTLWMRAKRDPAFPQPRKIGPRTTIFIEHEIDSYMVACARRPAGGEQ